MVLDSGMNYRCFFVRKSEEPQRSEIRFRELFVFLRPEKYMFHTDRTTR